MTIAIAAIFTGTVKQRDLLAGYIQEKKLDNNRRQTPPKLPTSDRSRPLYTALAIAAVAAAGFMVWSMVEDAPNTTTQTNVERTN